MSNLLHLLGVAERLVHRQRADGLEVRRRVVAVQPGHEGEVVAVAAVDDGGGEPCEVELRPERHREIPVAAGDRPGHQVGAGFDTIRQDEVGLFGGGQGFDSLDQKCRGPPPAGSTTRLTTLLAGRRPQGCATWPDGLGPGPRTVTALKYDVEGKNGAFILPPIIHRSTGARGPRWNPQPPLLQPRLRKTIMGSATDPRSKPNGWTGSNTSGVGMMT